MCEKVQEGNTPESLSQLRTNNNVWEWGCRTLKKTYNENYLGWYCKDIFHVTFYGFVVIIGLISVRCFLEPVECDPGGQHSSAAPQYFTSIVFEHTNFSFNEYCAPCNFTFEADICGPTDRPPDQNGSGPFCDSD